jgi:hypothetical protein
MFSTLDKQWLRWLSYVKEVLEPRINLTADEREFLKVTFFAGATSGLLLMRDALIEEESRVESLEAFDKLIREAKQWMES